MKLKYLLTSSVLCSAVAAAAARGQDPAGDPPGKLTQVPPGAPVNPFQAPPPRAGTDEFDADAWRARLVDADLEQRLEAFEQAAAIARRGGEARRAIERWAESATEPELAWTATLLLREADRARDPFADFFGRRPGTERFPDWQPFSRGGPFGGLDPFAGRDPFSGLAPAPLPPQGGTSRAESFRMEQSPDGVRVELRTKAEDGSEEVQTFEAPTIEELLEQHPELSERMGGMSVRVGQLDPLDVFDRVLPELDVPLPGVLQRVPAGTRTDVLGIRMREPGDWNAGRAGVGVDEGLLVVEIVPGTIASAMGVEPNEVLVELNGRRISRAADVAAVLRERHADEALTAVLVDESGARVTRTWAPRDL